MSKDLVGTRLNGQRGSDVTAINFFTIYCIYSFNPKRPGLLGGVLFGEMQFVLSNCLLSEDLSISYES